MAQEGSSGGDVGAQAGEGAVHVLVAYGVSMFVVARYRRIGPDLSSGAAR